MTSRPSVPTIAPGFEGYRLSPQQRAAWLAQPRAQGIVYRTQCLVLATGQWNAEAMRTAFAAIVARHQVLRTQFRLLPGMTAPLQVIGESTNAWRAIDLSHCDETTQAAELESLVEGGGDCSIEGPPATITVVTLSPERRALLISVPALCADPVTLHNLFREIGQAYERALLGGPAIGEGVQYLQFSEWQNQLLDDDDPEVESGRAFWKASVPRPIPLPFERCQEAGAFGPRSSTCRLDAPLAGAHSDSWLLACWQILLTRLTGSPEVWVHVHSDGRPFEELRDALGLFANYLPVPAGLTGEVAFSEVVRRTERALRDARQWQLCWEPSLEPAIDTIGFEYQERPADYRAGGLVFSLARLDCPIERYKLKLAITKIDGQGLQVAFHYDPCVLGADTVARIADSFVALTRSAFENPDFPVSQLAILSLRERQRLLTDMSRTGTGSGERRCVHQQFEAQVERTPNEVALVCDDDRLTYGELNARANRLAHFLRRNGVARGSCIPLFVERSIDALVGVLGILKAGGAYVPLEPGNPKIRLARQLDGLGAPLLLTQRALREALPTFNGKVVCIDDGQMTVESAVNPPPAGTLEDLVYVLHTSGSTGNSKGVAVTHGNLANYVDFIVARLDLAQGRRRVFATVSTLSADLGNTCIFPSLVSGGCLHVMSYRIATDGAGFADYVARHSIDVLKIVPSHLETLLDAGATILPRQHLVLGGEALSWKLAERIAQCGGTCRLINHYGPTETTVGSLTYDIGARCSDSATVPIGRPIADTEIYVLDPHGNPVPIGVSGELHIGGAGVARGYLDQPHLTAEKFVSNPFSADPESRLYRTGDRVRYLPDGNVEFLGRIDQQVKIRGFRVELEEIESVLKQHPQVRNSVVVVRGDGAQRLIAFIVVRKNLPFDPGELREFIKQHLPGYMVPSVFVRMDDFPRTLNGKVDYNALSVPDETRPDSAARHIAPRTAIEETVAGIFAEVLAGTSVNVADAADIGVDDDFFERGGHSLLAMQVVSRVRRSLRVELAVRDLFTHPTVAQLGVRIAALLKEAQVPSQPALEGASAAAPQPLSPLSFSQQRLWLLDRIEPQGAAYVIAGALELRGTLDMAALQRALEALVERHEALRTRFVKSEDGVPLQAVAEPAGCTLPMMDLSGDDDARVRLKTLLREEASHGFDLDSGPLFRARLYRVATDTHVLFLAMHHIISDGWSMRILHRELAALYGALCRGEKPSLQALRLQYRDFARWQRNWLQGDVLDTLIGHWRERLAGAPQVLELPTDRVRPPVESHRGGGFAFSLPAELTQALRRLSQREGVTLFMTLVSAFTLLMARYSGQRELLVGTPVAGRNSAEIENLVGCFINTLVLRADLSDDPSVSQYLARMREVCLDAYAHQDLPFERLVEAMRPERDVSRNPLFQVMFALQNRPLQPLALQGLTVKFLRPERTATQFDLVLQMRETSDALSGEFIYATDLFDESTVARMATHLHALLEAMSAAPEGGVWALPLLTSDERARLLVEWNDTKAEYPRHVLLHQLFEAQADRTPARPAVKAGATTLSYAALDERANRLAHAIRARGVTPGQRVGLCVERSSDLLAAILAILKAGGAYVPLDSAFPEARLRIMAEDAQPGLLVATTESGAACGVPRARQLLLDADATEIASAPATRLPPDGRNTQPADAAYLIYTSGSTGQPKGVVVPHRAVVNFLNSMAREPGLAADDVLVAVTTLSFDISVLELQLPLMVGATVVIASREEAADGHALGALLEQHGATVMQATPVTWRLLLNAGWKAGTPFKALVGGEALPDDLADQLIDQGVALWNLYGPTETTVWSTCARITSTAGGIPIGKPIANTTVRVLDGHGNLCPIGIPGELCIGGAGVALGYWNRPALTAERFLPDPFDAQGQGRLYRTGDRARWRPDGTLEHLGRLDDQIKLRGLRIELGEIEATLAEHPQVRAAAVRMWSVAANDMRIVACYVPSQGGLTPISLRKYLRARLPEYMIPQNFLMVDTIPMTVNGKVDRRRLPIPVIAQNDMRRNDAPADGVEATIADIWTRLIHPARPVGRGDKFFEMGGHSLLAMQALSQIEDKFAVRLGFRVLLRDSLMEVAAQCRSESCRNQTPDPSTP